jgi:hypothetical protein
MSTYAMKLTTFSRPEKTKNIPTIGLVKSNKVVALSNLTGRAVRCTSGHLWITLENDVMDHVLRAGQSLTIPTEGKVIISGQGAYAIGQDTKLPLAS